MVVGLLGNKSSDSDRLIPVTPKSENDVRLQATLGNRNPTGLPVGAVRIKITNKFPSLNDDEIDTTIYEGAVKDFKL